VMKLLNLHEVLILRTGNFIFLAAGILYALKYFTKKLNIDYLQGIKIGAYVTAFSVLPFALFMYFYLHLDAEFMSIVQQHSPFGDYLNPGVASGALVFEGVASGLLFTYIVMPYFKKE
ncbi:MAG: hypothetical protein KDD29_06020, partial [Flavobacteriales bacterium]|nr:hypothetical protein [Flavobacteriales bacterium]